MSNITNLLCSICQSRVFSKYCMEINKNCYGYFKLLLIKYVLTLSSLLWKISLVHSIVNISFNPHRLRLVTSAVDRPSSMHTYFLPILLSFVINNNLIASKLQTGMKLLNQNITIITQKFQWYVDMCKYFMWLDDNPLLFSE